MSAAALSLRLARVGLALDETVSHLEQAELGEPETWLMVAAVEHIRGGLDRLDGVVRSLETYGRPVPPAPIPLSAGVST